MLELPEEFYVGKYKITLRCKDTIMLSDFKGSTLRGALLNSFYKIACVQKARNSCEGCLVRDNCSFSYIFKSTITDESKSLSNLQSVPRPYALYIPLFEQSNKYSPGEELSFEITLIGRANKYIGHLILALKRLEKEGLGRGRGKFILEKIRTLDNRIVYRHEEDRIDKKGTIINGKDIQAGKRENNKLEIKYITPMRLKYDGEYCHRIEFHHLIRNLCRRVSMLSRVYCDRIIDWDFQEVIKGAEDILIEENEFEWKELRRYSSTQNQHLKYGGVIGKAIYRGNIDYYLPLVKIGSLIQVGKNTTFGLGKYNLKIN